MRMILDSPPQRWLPLRVLEEHKTAWRKSMLGRVLLRIVPGPTAGPGRGLLRAELDGTTIGLLSPESSSELSFLAVVAQSAGHHVYLHGRIQDSLRHLGWYSYNESHPDACTGAAYKSFAKARDLRP